jgi:hypothetical protein
MPEESLLPALMPLINRGLSSRYVDVARVSIVSDVSPHMKHSSKILTS